jgi:hypothetical protein
VVKEEIVGIVVAYGVVGIGFKTLVGIGVGTVVRDTSSEGPTVGTIAGSSDLGFSVAGLEGTFVVRSMFGFSVAPVSGKLLGAKVGINL